MSIMEAVVKGSQKLKKLSAEITKALADAGHPELAIKTASFNFNQTTIYTTSRDMFLEAVEVLGACVDMP